MGHLSQGNLPISYKEINWFDSVVRTESLVQARGDSNNWKTAPEIPKRGAACPMSVPSHRRAAGGTWDRWHRALRPRDVSASPEDCGTVGNVEAPVVGICPGPCYLKVISIGKWEQNQDWGTLKTVCLCWKVGCSHPQLRWLLGHLVLPAGTG